MVTGEYIYGVRVRYKSALEPLKYQHSLSPTPPLRTRHSSACPCPCSMFTRPAPSDFPTTRVDGCTFCFSTQAARPLRYLEARARAVDIARRRAAPGRTLHGAGGCVASRGLVARRGVHAACAVWRGAVSVAGGGEVWRRSVGFGVRRHVRARIVNRRGAAVSPVSLAKDAYGAVVRGV